MDPLFKVSDRIRVKANVRGMHPQMKSYRGTVVSVEICRNRDGKFGGYVFDVLRDGVKGRWLFWQLDTGHPFYHRMNGARCERGWELIPLRDLTLDEVGRQLAKAYLDGDVSSLRPLVDRAQEMLNDGAC